MGFLKLLDSEFLNLRKIINFSGDAVTDLNNEQEELQEMLNNVGQKTSPLIDVALKQTVSSRVMEKEVQEVIQKFNSLSIQEKSNILDFADAKLKDKLMNFMNKNADFMNIEDELNNTFKLIYENINSVSARRTFDKAEIDSLVDIYEKIRNYAMANADNVIDAFTEYKDEPNSKTQSLNTETEAILNKGSKLKQALLSYSLLFESKVNEINSTKKTDKKAELFQDLTEIINKMQRETEKFNTDASDAMNSFIPTAIQSKNQFYAQLSKYIKNGVSQNFNLDNKEYENAFIDAMLDTLAYKGTPLA